MAHNTGYITSGTDSDTLDPPFTRIHAFASNESPGKVIMFAGLVDGTSDPDDIVLTVTPDEVDTFALELIRAAQEARSR